MTARPIGTRSRADGTRETILDFLRGHDERSVDDLAGEPGLAGATVRVGGPPLAMKMAEAVLEVFKG